MEQALLPVLVSSCDASKPLGDLVLDEGLVLWRNMLLQAGFLSEQLNSFFPNLPLICEKYKDDTTTYVEANTILESYFILGKTRFFNQHTEKIIEVLSHGISHYHKNKIYWTSVDALRTLVRIISPEQLPQLSLLFQHVWQILITGKTPIAKTETREHGLYTSVFLFFDLYIKNPNFFVGLTNHFAGSLDLANQQISHFLGIVEKINPNNIRLTITLRLMSMGLALFLPMISNDIQKSQTLIIKIVEFSNAVDKKESVRKKKRKWVEPPCPIRSSPVHRMKIEMLKANPIQKVDLKQFLNQQIGICVSNNGPGWDQSVFSSLPAQTMEYFRNPT